MGCLVASKGNGKMFHLSIANCQSKTNGCGRAWLFVLAGLMFWSNPIQACRIKADPLVRAAGVTQDLAFQRDRIKQLARQSDIIVIATLSDKEAPRNRFGVTQGTLQFAVQTALKGKPSGHLIAQASGEFEIGCGAHASEGFTQVNIDAGQTYILYLADGVILRAGKKSNRGEELVSFADERLLLRRAVWRKKK
jgi:hypothetical protein